MLRKQAKKDFTNPDNTVYSSYYAKVVTPDGTVNEYATSSDCSSLKCAVVNVSFTNGKASLSRAKGYDNVSGKLIPKRINLAIIPLQTM